MEFFLEFFFFFWGGVAALDLSCDGGPGGFWVFLGLLVCLCF